MDWWGGFTVGFAKYWTFTGEHVEFVFPGGGSVYNYDFTLAFNDGGLWPWPVAFNPFVTFWYVADGGAVPLGTSTGYPGHCWRQSDRNALEANPADLQFPDIGHDGAGDLLEPEQRHDKLLRSVQRRAVRTRASSDSSPPVSMPS